MCMNCTSHVCFLLFHTFDHTPTSSVPVCVYICPIVLCHPFTFPVRPRPAFTPETAPPFLQAVDPTHRSPPSDPRVSVFQASSWSTCDSRITSVGWGGPTRVRLLLPEFEVQASSWSLWLHPSSHSDKKHRPVRGFTPCILRPRFLTTRIILAATVFIEAHHPCAFRQLVLRFTTEGTWEPAPLPTTAPFPFLFSCLPSLIAVFRPAILARTQPTLFRN